MKAFDVRLCLPLLAVFLTGCRDEAPPTAAGRAELDAQPPAASRMNEPLPVPWTIYALIGGQIADADGDGLGDNHMEIPGDAPVLGMAGVQMNGGPGCNGTVRLHFVWPLTGLDPTAITQAQVVLTTNRGNIDQMDTFFFHAQTDGNSLFEDSDFQMPTVQVPGAVMPVTGEVGNWGEFAFEVTEEILHSLAQGHHFFTVQGRVDESLSGPRRGLCTALTVSWNEHERWPRLNVTPPEVVIDIQPGSDDNTVDLDCNGKVPVAVLGSEELNVSLLDEATLRFGPARAYPAGRFVYQADVNTDGYTDLVAHFRTQETGIEAGDTAACLLVRTIGGTLFRACDAISIRSVSPDSPSPPPWPGQDLYSVPVSGTPGRHQ